MNTNKRDIGITIGCSTIFVDKRKVGRVLRRLKTNDISYRLYQSKQEKDDVKFLFYKVSDEAKAENILRTIFENQR